MPPLAELQRGFIAAITSPHGDDARARALASEIRRHGVLDAVDRIGIYAHMYCARLVGALTEDYPRVAAVLGSDDFAEVAHRYVETHPSTHPSLRWFGQQFAGFLEAQGGIRIPAFVGALARLEWSRLEVFDAEDAESLDIESLRRVPAETWPILWLEAVPAVSVLDVTWPVHRIWMEPDSNAHWRPEAIRLRIWRQDDEVFQVPLDVVERTALPHVLRGTDFASLCESLAAIIPPEDAPTTAAALVLRWVEDGILKRSFAKR